MQGTGSTAEVIISAQLLHFPERSYKLCEVTQKRQGGLEGVRVALLRMRLGAGWGELGRPQAGGWDVTTQSFLGRLWLTKHFTMKPGRELEGQPVGFLSNYPQNKYS